MINIKYYSNRGLFTKLEQQNVKPLLCRFMPSVGFIRVRGLILQSHFEY